MPILTWVSRVNDGMLLVASEPPAGNSYDHLDQKKAEGKQLVKTIALQFPDAQQRMSVESGNYLFHYSIADGICVLTLSERTYSRQRAYAYLNDIITSFVKMLERKYGDGWPKKIALISRPYMFIQFDLEIEKKRKKFLKGDGNMNVLKNEMHDIQNIMVSNIKSVLDRGSNLEACSERSAQLSQATKKYAWSAKKLNYQQQLKKWAPVIACVSVVLCVFTYKFIL